jgi:hypothetical protein
MRVPGSLLQACDFPIDGDGNKTIDEIALHRLKKEIEGVECTIRRANLEEKRKKIVAEYGPHFPIGNAESGWGRCCAGYEEEFGLDHVFMEYNGRFLSADYSKFQKVSVFVRFYDRGIKVACTFGRDYSPHPRRDVEFTLYDVTNPSELKARIISGIRETGDCCRDFLSNLESNAAF